MTGGGGREWLGVRLGHWGPQAGEGHAPLMAVGLNGWARGLCLSYCVAHSAQGPWM